MAILKTLRRQIRFPDGDQPANVPTDMSNMAADIDTFMPGGSGTIGQRPPATPGPGGAIGVPGSMYYASDTGEVSVSDGSVWHTVIAAGEIRPTARAAPPTGWLMCDGASLLRTDYPALFNALGGVGSPYGLPDSTHFQVPDLRGRAPVGEDGTAGRLTANNARGQSSGEERHALAIAEMPSHNHGGATGSMNRSNPHAHSIADPGHAHSAWNTGIPDFSMSIGGSGVGMLSDNAGAPFRYQAGVSVAAAGTGIGIYGTDINHEHAISAQGGAGSPVHNNMQPYQVVNFIIKT